jgi:threonine/homoserine/homoserine lactone efflux protein
MNLLIFLGGGVFIGLMAAAPIGPVNLICIRRTLAYGPVIGFLSGLGAALGDGVFACITGFGLTAVTQLIEGYATPLQLIGGMLLLAFGLHIFRADIVQFKENENPSPRDAGSRSLAQTAISTFALTITNPATLIGFTAMFAGLDGLAGRPTRFVDAALSVGGVVGGSVLWWFTVTTVTGIFHRRIDAEVMNTINHVFGILVAGFGAFVLGNLAWQSF